eukprot:COSAG06_NODE_3740_length_4957_cov_8.283821_6_plen_63_part_00
MTGADLQKLLRAAHAAGLRRLNYHHHGNLSESEWTIMSALCGEMWVPPVGDDGYRPPDKMVI